LRDSADKYDRRKLVRKERIDAEPADLRSVYRLAERENKTEFDFGSLIPDGINFMYGDG
jgi:hypothetical protein